MHELAHQWFGDSLAVERWQHIWLNEGFATYAEWLWSEHEGLGTAQEIFDNFYNGIPAGRPVLDVTIGDPGPDNLFDISVYWRGGMTLHQLRLAVGDDDFFRILRRWAQRSRRAATSPPTSSSPSPSRSPASSSTTCSRRGCSPPGSLSYQGQQRCAQPDPWTCGMHHQWFARRRSASAGPSDLRVASASMVVGIEVGLDEGVQLIRLTRPDEKNALSSEMYTALCDALDRGDASDDVAVHVFVGSDGVFTAGNDLADFLAFSAEPDARRLPALDFIDRLPRVSKPMVAAVDGLAVGVGTTMLLHCDLVYASPRASFRTPFVDLGLVPEAGSTLLAVQRMGYARAFELLLPG